MRGEANNMRNAGLALVAAAAVLAVPEVALATTDTTFGDPLDTVQDIVGGTGGQLAAALAVGVGIAAGAGTGIVTGLVGTAIV